jgi:uncharacterized protein (TIGR03083 family)
MTDTLIHHVIPIEVVHLFPVLDRELISLLNGLSPEDWQKPTIAKEWTVKDIAAHLLDTSLRELSMLRDGYFGEKPDNISIPADLINYLNRLNAEWVQAAKRLSPRVLITMLESVGREYNTYLSTVDPWADATWAVAWAGEEISKNWFHIARNYTEKWIHQQQIRDAVGKPGIMTRELFFPFINTFMCALPQTYRYTNAPTGTSVVVAITSDIGGVWHINKTDHGWVLRNQTRLEPNATVTIHPDTAWRLFSKGIRPEEALSKVQITGDENLGRIALGMVSVMA